jgi:Icc-related predicted phosphoesterase
MKIAAVADLHCEIEHIGFWAPRLRPVNDEADCLILAGDLTSTGDLGELRVLLGELEAITIPIVTVLGNHDYDSGRARVIAETLRRAGINNLEGNAAEIDDVAFVGGMGVEGGFATNAGRRWSYVEQQFMARLRHYLSSAEGRRVAVLHYVPVPGTLVGEDEELFPLLGSSAMESVIDEVGADLILHGHAHNGVAESTTAGGIPVFNVSLPVLGRAGYGTPYRVFEI